MMMVRGGVDSVRLYTKDYQLVAMHPRAAEAGQRQTNTAQLPPTHLNGLLMTREVCQKMAAEMGEATQTTVTAILSDTAVDRLPAARRLLRLRETFGQARLEAACARANSFGDASYKTVKRILVNGLDKKAIPSQHSIKLPSGQFVRPAEDILGEWAEVAQWS